MRFHKYLILADYHKNSSLKKYKFRYNADLLYYFGIQLTLLENYLY